MDQGARRIAQTLVYRSWTRKSSGIAEFLGIQLRIVVCFSLCPVLKGRPPENLVLSLLEHYLFFMHHRLECVRMNSCPSLGTMDEFEVSPSAFLEIN
jgi:hypothetical protein